MGQIIDSNLFEGFLVMIKQNIIGIVTYNKRLRFSVPNNHKYVLKIRL